MFACLHAPGNAELLIEYAGHFSPLIEQTSSGTVVFDVRGLNLIIGSPEKIAFAIRQKVSIPADLAIASNPDAAIHAARGRGGTTIIPSGKEAVILAPLPLHLLGGSPVFAEALFLWGIRTFGEFAALPPLGVAARLGDEGAQMQQLACGKSHRQLRLLVEPVLFREEKELEDSVELLDPLLFLLFRMLNELCERLRFHGRSTNELRLRLKLERSSDHITALRLPVPMRDSNVLLKLLELELSDHPPQAAVEKIQLELLPVEPRTTQHGLFLPSAPEPERWEITLARIRKLVGTENVGVPELLNTHRPDSLRMGSLKKKESGVSAPSKLALRRFRPPHPAQVWCVGGKPVKITSAQITGCVIAWAGPWHLSGDWWTNEAYHRQEWDIEIYNAGVFRICQCGRGIWFIEGNYD